MTPNDIAAAFGNTPEALARYGGAPVSLNSDEARIYAAFGRTPPPRQPMSINAQQMPDVPNGVDLPSGARIVFGADVRL